MKSGVRRFHVWTSVASATAPLTTSRATALTSASLAALLHGTLIALLLQASVSEAARAAAPRNTQPLIAIASLDDHSTALNAIPKALQPLSAAALEAINLPLLPPPNIQPVAADSFADAREAQSPSDVLEITRLQGVYLGQLNARIARVLEMTASREPARAGRCEAHVIQNEAGDVLDVQFTACVFDGPRRHRLTMAIRRASPLPAPPSGLAMGSYLTLDVSSL